MHTSTVDHCVAHSELTFHREEVRWTIQVRRVRVNVCLRAPSSMTIATPAQSVCIHWRVSCVLLTQRLQVGSYKRQWIRMANRLVKNVVRFRSFYQTHARAGARARALARARTCTRTRTRTRTRARTHTHTHTLVNDDLNVKCIASSPDLRNFRTLTGERPSKCEFCSSHSVLAIYWHLHINKGNNYLNVKCMCIIKLHYSFWWNHR